MQALFTQIIKDFLELKEDYRAEVLGAELIKNGLPYNKIYFKAIGDFKRATGRDVESVQWDPNGSDHLMLELNREGIYDMLPEGIFHLRTTDKKDKETVLRDIRKTRIEENFARKFFHPFENEFFQISLQLEAKKRSLLQPDSPDSNREFFQTIFGDTSLLNEQQILALLYILPIAHRIRGDLDKIAYCISILIGHKAEILASNIDSCEKYEGQLPGLGTARLGIDSIAGKCFRSSNKFYDIVVRNVERKKLTSFFTNGSNHSIIQYISDFLFPYDSKFRIIPEVTDSDRDAYLSGNNIESFLGYSFCL